MILDLTDIPIMNHESRIMNPFYGSTVTITSFVVSRPPSLARTRTTKAPGAPNVTVTGNFPSGGIGGGAHPGDHGEFSPGCLSWYTLNCSGLNLTALAGPR